MKKVITISYHDMELDFDNYTIRIDDKIYKGDEISITKTVNVKTSKVRTGSTGCSVRVARGVYLRKTKPSYEKNSVVIENIVITDLNTDYKEIFTFVKNDINTSLLFGWHKKKNYDDIVKEYEEKEKEKKEDMNAIGTVIFLSYAVTFMIMLTGHFLAGICLFVPLMLIFYSVIEIERKGMTLENKRNVFAWIVAFIAYIIILADIQDPIISVLPSIGIYMVSSVISTYIIKK